MKEKNAVIKSNVLLESRYKITSLEMRIFLSVIAQIKRDDKSLKTYRIYIQDFLNKAELKGNFYSRITTACRSLISKAIEIEEVKGTSDEGHLIISFFSSARTFKNHGYIDINIDERLKPYLIQLRKNFTIYDIRNVLQCRSTHSIRIYQLLKQYEKLGKRAIPLDDLKKMLGVAGKYEQWINMKSKIMTPAQKELKAYSDIYFTYKAKRTGRKIGEIEFRIKRKKQKRMFDRKEDENPYLSFEEVMKEEEQIDRQERERWEREQIERGE